MRVSRGRRPFAVLPTRFLLFLEAEAEADSRTRQSREEYQTTSLSIGGMVLVAVAALEAAEAAEAVLVTI